MVMERTPLGLSSLSATSSLHIPSKKYVVFFLLALCSVFSFSYFLSIYGPAEDALSSRLVLVEEGDKTNHRVHVSAHTVLSDKFWSVLDLEGKILCGEYKCLFRHKKSHDAAYLVGNNYRGYQFEEEWEMTYELAQYLQSTFSIKHLYLEPPTRVMVIQSALETFENRTKRKVANEPMYTSGNLATVQKVRLAPEPKIVMVATSRKWTTFKWFYRKRVMRSKAVNETLFVSTLRDDVEVTLNALEANPLLARDFQVMIDTGGNIWHFDLDRVFFQPQKVPVAFDRSKKILRRLAIWAYEESGNKEFEQTSMSNRSGDEVLTESLANNSSLSCKALKAVNAMKGRKGGTINADKSREGKLMIVQLVQKIMRRNETEEWNCSL